MTLRRNLTKNLKTSFFRGQALASQPTELPVAVPYWDRKHGGSRYFASRDARATNLVHEPVADVVGLDDVAAQLTKIENRLANIEGKLTSANH